MGWFCIKKLCDIFAIEANISAPNEDTLSDPLLIETESLELWLFSLAILICFSKTGLLGLVDRLDY